jgi:hypothetical protein
MADEQASTERELLRRWVDTWRQAGKELDEVRRRELESIDTQEAIWPLFGDEDYVDDSPLKVTSGLVEQQAWFAKLRTRESQGCGQPFRLRP